MASIHFDSMDIDTYDTDIELPEDPQVAYFKIALDFGTTRTSVACMKYEKEELPPGRRLDPERDIFMIENFPDAPPNSYYPRQEVPTELWFPPKRQQQQNPVAEIGSSLETDRLTPPSDSDEEALREAQAIADMNASKVEMLENNLRWGYGVQERQTNIGFEDDDDDGQTITNFKLLLGESKDEETEQLKKEIQAAVKDLRRRHGNLIKNQNDLFFIYLQRLFQHVYEQLVELYGFNERCHVEPILCVPAMWGPKACRVMIDAASRAMREAGLFGPPSTRDPDFFIVSEPEAASTLVLEKSRGLIRPRETFVLLDAGGGTVDTVCYSVSLIDPLRLEKEEVKEEAKLCGSSYLNLAFKEILKQRLDPAYLVPWHSPIDRMIDRAMDIFEYKTKRNIDITKRAYANIEVPGVVGNDSMRFGNNTVFLSGDELKEIFCPRLDEVAKLMEDQLTAALAKKKNVRSVILIGGFADSIWLRNYLKHRLALFNSANGTQARLHQLQSPGSLAIYSSSTAVARGAILRASRKEEGPKRQLRSSFGLLRREQYDPAKFPAHRVARKQRDPCDGDYYINTIDWVLVKGEEVDQTFFEHRRMIHTFSHRAKEFKCEEIIYVRDDTSESHYHPKHEKNSGAEVLAPIVVDMTFLKTEKKLELTVPEPETGLKPYYEVILDLVMRVNGRNLTVEALWPPLQDGEAFSGQHTGSIQNSIHQSIAAAFDYGTN